ncbi:MAG: hypothetical protein M1827_003084 [Pycnora praestabilis]|nr:MAG: hypothetical protein M1827_003084 [Pycnora praestabilis]
MRRSSSASLQSNSSSSQPSQHHHNKRRIRSLPQSSLPSTETSSDESERSLSCHGSGTRRPGTEGALQSLSQLPIPSVVIRSRPAYTPNTIPLPQVAVHLPKVARNAVDGASRGTIVSRRQHSSGDVQYVVNVRWGGVIREREVSPGTILDFVSLQELQNFENTQFVVEDEREAAREKAKEANRQARWAIIRAGNTVGQTAVRGVPKRPRGRPRKLANLVHTGMLGQAVDTGSDETEDSRQVTPLVSFDEFQRDEGGSKSGTESMASEHGVDLETLARQKLAVYNLKEIEMGEDVDRYNDQLEAQLQTIERLEQGSLSTNEQTSRSTSSTSASNSYDGHDNDDSDQAVAVQQASIPSPVPSISREGMNTQNERSSSESPSSNPQDDADDDVDLINDEFPDVDTLFQQSLSNHKPRPMEDLGNNTESMNEAVEDADVLLQHFRSDRNIDSQAVLLDNADSINEDVEDADTLLRKFRGDHELGLSSRPVHTTPKSTSRIAKKSNEVKPQTISPAVTTHRIQSPIPMIEDFNFPPRQRARQDIPTISDSRLNHTKPLPVVTAQRSQPRILTRKMFTSPPTHPVRQYNHPTNGLRPDLLEPSLVTAAQLKPPSTTIEDLPSSPWRFARPDALKSEELQPGLLAERKLSARISTIKVEPPKVVGKSKKRQAKSPPAFGQPKRLRGAALRSVQLKYGPESMVQAPEEQDDSAIDEYHVEEILGDKVLQVENKAVRYYLIKWLGWSYDANTWEPESNLQGAREMLDQYYAVATEGARLDRLKGKAGLNMSGSPSARTNGPAPRLGELIEEHQQKSGTEDREEDEGNSSDSDDSSDRSSELKHSIVPIPLFTRQL